MGFFDGLFGFARKQRALRAMQDSGAYTPQQIDGMLSVKPSKPLPAIPVTNESVTPKIEYTVLTEKDATLLQEIKYGYNPYDNLTVRPGNRQTLNDYAEGSYNVVSALINVWANAVQTRRDHLLITEELDQFYTSLAIINLVVGDILNPDETGTIVEFVATVDEDAAKNELIQKELDDLYDNIDFNSIITDMVHDFVALGEYSLRLEFHVNEAGVSTKKGLKAIHDDVDQLNLLALYTEGEPAGFLHLLGDKYVMEPPYRYAHFINGSSKIRVALEDQLEPGFTLSRKQDLPKEVQDKIPDYVRLGRPMFWGMVSKLRELQLLEQLIPATKLNAITQSQIVTLKVPATMPPNKVLEVCRKYEDILNMPTGIDTSRQQISLAEILNASGRARVLPDYTDGKGGLSVNDVRGDVQVDDILKSIQDIRGVICTSMGIPPSILFGSDSKDKVQELRLFGRYTRNLAQIQNSIARGIKQIIAAHLINKGIEVTKDDFDVKFCQSLVDISGLEKLEFDDAKQEIVGRTLDFVAKMTANPVLAPYINMKHLAKWLQVKFNNLTDGESIFNEEPNMDTVRLIRLLRNDAPSSNPDSGTDTPANDKVDSVATSGQKDDNQDQFPSGQPLKFNKAENPDE